MVKCPDCKKGELLSFTQSVMKGTYLKEPTSELETVYKCSSCGNEIRIGQLPFPEN